MQAWVAGSVSQKREAVWHCVSPGRYQLDVPAFLRKLADFAEKNKELIDEQDYYEYKDELGVCEFDYE